MATGLLALLDDVVAISKVAAASLDDVVAQAGRAGMKAAGVVIDDAAVTPRYVVGFAAARELPIVGKIAFGSLKNKILFLLPGALALSYFAPWAINPLLMAGGLFLCYEGAEKVLEAVAPHKAHAHEAKVSADPTDPATLEAEKVSGAIRTDFILSAEIMALTLSTMPPESPLVTQAAVLAIVGVGITVAVYGTVALIVKADDAGVAMAASRVPAIGPAVRATGRGLVKGMPYFLKLLSTVGTAAMLWVGGGIIVHGLAVYGIHAPEEAIHHVAEATAALVPAIAGGVSWLVSASAAALVGIVLGGLTIPVVGKVLAPISNGIGGLFRGGRAA